MYSIEALFGRYLNAEALTPFEGVKVLSCVLNSENRSLKIDAKCDNYIELTLINDLKEQIKSALNLNEIEFNASFIGCEFTPEACCDIVAGLRIKNAVLNGYFNGAEYEIAENAVKINLKFGGLAHIKETDFEKAFVLEAKRLFDIDVTVEFGGQTADTEINLPPAPPPVKREQSKPAGGGERKISFEPREDKPQNGLVYLDNPVVFYGRNIGTDTKEMIKVTDDDVDICCWGEVFGLETKEITTKRGTKATIVKFSFSDHTNSLNASLFIDSSRMGEIAPLKNGAFILVNGTYEFDDFKKEFAVKVKALALLQKYEEKDNYDGDKRVELHCHTNMSSKDAVSSAGDIIKQAYSWGHKAIAITDHGVVQAYPAAAAAVKGIRKGGGDFKVIYGVKPIL